jgi:hypothetical protein
VTAPEPTLSPAQGFAAAVAAEAAEDETAGAARADVLAARLIEVQVELGKVQRSALKARALAARHRVRLGRVRALHFRSFRNQNRCGHCGHTWPCPTITALDQT